MHKIRLEKHSGARKLNPEIPRELERIIAAAWRSRQRIASSRRRTW